MKNAYVFFAFVVLAFSLFAAGGGYGQPEGAAHEPGTGIQANASNQAEQPTTPPVTSPEENQMGQGSGQGNQIAQEQQARNQGENQQIAIENRNQIVAQAQNGSGLGAQRGYSDERGNSIDTDNGTRLRVRDVEAHSSLNLTPVQDQNRTRIQANLSNGRNAEIKIMPDTASETALMHLRIRNCNESNGCTIQLKEVGSGNDTRAAYSVQATKHAKILGIFDATMPVEAEVDAETGAVISTGKPWWAFLASEQDE